jgi:hypothetical protein
MSKKLTYDYVKDFIEKEGYQLLSKIYKNTNSKIKVKCPYDHVYEVTFGNFKIGRRCPGCFNNKQTHSYKHVKDFIEKEGYQLLSKTYKNANSKIKIKCPYDHVYEVTFGNFYRGQRCAKCNGGIRLTYDYVKAFIEKEGYQLLSDTYKNARSKLKIKCSHNHVYETIFDVFQRGCRCPICNFKNRSSKAEIEIQNYIEALGYDIIRNDRTQILNPLTGYNLELDIWIPSLNKAIEYNGDYWHSLYKIKKYDKIKKEQCKKKGINLFIIKEYNWNNNKLLEFQKIKNWL